jgi:hypothetical protein
MLDYHNQVHINGINRITDTVQAVQSKIGDESDLWQGLPSRSFKSYGYRNPHEHYYQYISDEIQTHLDLPFPRGGVSCRNNKKTNKK